jgi:anti-sigma-K factor RskA
VDIQTYISSGIIESYALGTASAEESSILQCVMKNNEEVRLAVFATQKTFEKFATLQAIEPPSYLKTEILKRIEFENENLNKGKIIPLNREKTLESINSGFPNWMKVASVAAIFGLGYLGYQVNSKDNQLQEIAQNNTELSSKIVKLEEMNSMVMNSLRIELKGVPNHPNMLADVYWHTSKKVFLEMKNLPAAPNGHQYQLWAIVDGKAIDMGLYNSKKDSAVQEMKSVEKAQAFAVTLEKEGGNSTPTMEEMFVMGTI